MPMPTYHQCVRMLDVLAGQRSEWAGIPMLVNDYDLVLEPRFPYQLGPASNGNADAESAGLEIVNVWWCDKLMAEVYVIKEHGKLTCAVLYARGGKRGRKLIDDLVVSSVWLIEAEMKAMAKLKAMIRPHLFEAYLMTGAFLETSPRSKLTYLFRRLRPTVVMSGAGGDMQLLCTLCLHPIGYYKDTHCGVMVPTDEVLAHLTYMRGDEHGFWKHSNQHPSNHPNSSL